MLTDLSITDYVIAKKLDVDFRPGMTALTGETGAGKSILLGALGLALGGRGDGASVRPGSDRAEINAVFDLQSVPAAREWLQQQELAAEDDTLVLRRSVNGEGRSRAWINGRPGSLQSLRELGSMLVDIHGQHAHQKLLRRDHQCELLDAFAGCRDLATEVAGLAQKLQRAQREQRDLKDRQQARSAEAQLLRYQLDEIEDLQLDAQSLSALTQEQHELANAGALLQASEQALNSLSDDNGAREALQTAMQALEAINPAAARQQAALELIGNAVIHLQEAELELERHRDEVELDPTRLDEVESQLSRAFDVARKHRVKPAQLFEHAAALQAQLDSITGCDAALEALQEDINGWTDQYSKRCKLLSKKRRAGAKTLQAAVELQLRELSMENCRFALKLTPADSTDFSAQGGESVDFFIATNPASEPAALSKIASGGELSRISLAIQVVTARADSTPTLVFDEVDVGIGGATAERVGELLRQLGEHAQVLCVTHQAQVAGQANQHFKVAKQLSQKSVSTTVEELDDSAKIEEIARMMGGVAITDNTRAHARELLRH